jgi:acyl-homoserine-lactone acylase
MRHLSFALVMLAVLGSTQRAAAQTPDELASQVVIRRTVHGVPHITGQTLKAAAFGLAYVQMEDYGQRVAMGLLRGSGRLAAVFGRDSIDGDHLNRIGYLHAVAMYPTLEEDTRAVYEGFAEGVNRYISKHPEQFPPEMTPTFTGYDVATRDVSQAGVNGARRVIARLTGDTANRRAFPRDDDEGSNAWAFAPSRTASRRAVLVRNPHLSWDAGYYEGHITVPGVLDFYGDFRVGGPFTVIGGFNRELGWSTTNNAPDLDEVYELTADPVRPDHYLFDGTSVPLQQQLVTVEYRNGQGIGTETREFWRSPLGPVVHRANGKIYVYRRAADMEYRAGEQFLHMMRARSLEEWKEAMRMNTRLNSNFTYADRAGNIFYVWNALTPAFPHPSGGDTLPVPALRTSDVWTRTVPFDSLPQLLNPRGGYVRNENDTYHLTNLNQPLLPSQFPPNFPEPELRFRSQLSLSLIHQTRGRLTMQDIIRLKHSPRMLMAERLKDDLVAAVRAHPTTPTVDSAIAMIAAWDATTAVDSRGGVLFESWVRHYTRAAGGPDSLYAVPWSFDKPVATPDGIAKPRAAADAFAAAVEETAQRHGSWNVAWGEVHRVRRGKVDVPVTGCTGALGCFRVIQYRDAPDGKRVATGGDGWVLAVEFADQPRAWSVLAYGQTQDESSPYYDIQAEMFAKGEMKRVAFTPDEVEKAAVKTYRP